MNVRDMGVPGERLTLLSWLAGQLGTRGLDVAVVGGEGSELLRVRARAVRYLACALVPQYGTWAYVYSGGWVLVDDPRAVDLVLGAVTR